MWIVTGYLLALAVVTLLAIVSRVRAQGPNRAPTVDPQSVPVEDLALLAGGSTRAVVAGAIRLYEAGALAPGSRPAHLSVAGPVPPGCHELGSAVHDVVGRAGQADIPRLRHGLAGSPALHATRARLAAAGLIPAPNEVSRLRALRRALLILVVVGVPLIPVAFVADAAGAALLPLAVVAAAVLVIPVTRMPPVTRTGRLLLAGARSRATAFAGGGLPGQRALAFALFGPTAVRRADPALAHQLGLVPVQRRGSRSVRRSSEWAGESGCGGGGSGCGGGGGGSSCGGGGGGCGGGGGGCGGGG